MPLAPLAAALVLLAPSADPAPNPGIRARARPHVRATQIDDDDVQVDGRVTSREWALVPRLPTLVQTSPRYGDPITHPTEVKMAYGRKGLYVAFVCHDAHGDPDHVLGAVARKDQVPSSDKVSVSVDPDGDGMTGFFFEVNASGAQSDAYMFRDSRMDFLWDGVWSAGVQRTDDGWSAEIFVPWSTMRFPSQARYDFGFDVKRWVNEGAENQRLSPPPQGVPGQLSYAARYEDVTGVRPGLNLEIRPFISSRFALRRSPASLDDTGALLPNVGYTAKYGLTGSLTMDLAVNPDFGQAEVDPAVLNLGPFEVFFPERRQFFLESKEIFETRFHLVNTRRIGNNPSVGRANTSTRTIRGVEDGGRIVAMDPQTRILESLRVTGELRPGWRVGALTATTGPTFATQEFADGSRQRVTVDPVSQWTVARVRREFDGQSYVGGMITNVARFGGEPDAVTGGIDYAVRFRERYNHEAQVIGTHDGEAAGMGASAAINRSGRNTGVNVSGRMLTPEANHNDLGFMQFADFVEGDVRVDGFTAQPVGPFRRLEANSRVGTSSTFDGVIFRKQMMSEAALVTNGLWRVGVFGGGQLDRLDPYETRGGIPYRVPLHWWSGFNVRSPHNKRVVGRVNAAYGEQEKNPGPDLGLELTLRPVDRLQANLGVNLNSSFNRPRWVTNDAEDNPVFGRADLISTNATLRFTVGITPHLTLQSYNQLLYSTAHHTEFLRLDTPSTLTPIDGSPYDGVVDQSLTALVSNSVLRWEYMPGSFFFAVYTHRSVSNDGGMTVRWSPGSPLSNLAQATATHEDILFFKLVHLFGL